MEITIGVVLIVALIWGTSKPLDAGEKTKTNVKACLICVETGAEHTEDHKPMEEANEQALDTKPATTP